jgi:hypothetical protein
VGISKRSARCEFTVAKPWRLALAMALVGLALGCANPASRVRAHRASYPVQIGMTAEDLLDRWGRPVDVLRIQSSGGGVTEDWRYRHGRLDDIDPTSRGPVFVWLREGRAMATLE